MDGATAAMSTLLVVDTTHPTSAPTDSKFMMLPTEIRLEIFGHAMRAGGGSSMVRIDMVPDDEKEKLNTTRINASLFTVSRQVSQETQEAFFVSNTIRIRSPEADLSTLSQVRHLEYGDQAAHTLFYITGLLMRNILNTARALPNIQSINVVCDGLLRKKRKYGVKTVRELLCRNIGLPSSSIRCVDVGLFEIAPARTKLADVKFCFGKTALCKTLAIAKELAGRHSISELSRMINSLGEWTSTQAGCERYGYLDGAAFIKFYEVWRAKKAGDIGPFTRLTEAQQDSMNGFELDMGMSKTVPHLSPLLPSGVQLFDLIGNTGGYSEELLEWATEFLTMNVYTGAP